MSERIEDLERAIEWTAWLLSEGVYLNDAFLTARLRSMKAELANVKSIQQEAV